MDLNLSERRVLLRGDLRSPLPSTVKVERMFLHSFTSTPKRPWQNIQQIHSTQAALWSGDFPGPQEAEMERIDKTPGRPVGCKDSLFF